MKLRPQTLDNATAQAADEVTPCYELDAALLERVRASIGPYVADDVDRDDQVRLTLALLGVEGRRR